MKTCTATLCLAAGGHTSAQVLDLAGPEAPEAGAGRAAVELAARLDREADRIEESATPGALDDRRAGARVALRRAASSLAELGESGRDAGSAALLWAMTIDTRLAGLDEALASCDDAAILAAIEVDLNELDLAWSRGKPVPAEVLDEQIASAFAQLALEQLGTARPGVGWFSDDADASADDLRFRAPALVDLGMDESGVRTLEAAADEIETMNAWPAYRARGEAMAQDAVLAIDAVRALPEWCPDAARLRLLSDLADALAKPVASRSDSLLLAERHAALLSSLDRMEDGREADRLRARAADAIARRAHDDASGLPAARIAADALAISVERDNIRIDSHVVRELRPAWRRLVPMVRGITVNARNDAVGLLLDPSDATDPGVLASIAVQRRLFADFTVIERISTRLESGLDGPPELVKAVTGRLLGVAQAMQDDEQRDSSLALLRSFDRQLVTLDTIAADAETAVRVMGARGADLPPRIEELRSAWLRGWAIAGGMGPDADTLAELDLLAGVVALLADAEAFTRPETLNGWPGFEVTVRARRAMADGLTDAIDELLPDALRGGSNVARSRAERDLVNARGDYAAALLTGRLARLSARQGIALAGPLEETALGPPTQGSWMRRHREAIASVCRYAEELGRLATTSGRDSQELAKMRSLVGWRALRLLEQIERDTANGID